MQCIRDCAAVVLLQGVLAVPPCNQRATAPCNLCNCAIALTTAVHSATVFCVRLLRHCFHFAALQPMVSQSGNWTRGLVPSPSLFQLPLISTVWTFIWWPEISNRQIVLNHLVKVLDLSCLGTPLLVERQTSSNVQSVGVSPDLWSGRQGWLF